VVAAAEEEFRKGRVEEWDVERWFEAYEAVSKKTAPMVRVGGGVERGTWAWFRDLHGGTEEHADRERKIYEVWARRRTADEEEARLAKEVQLQQLRKEMQRESRKAIKTKFGSVNDYIAKCKNPGERSRLIKEMAGGGVKTREVRAVYDEEGKVQTEAKRWRMCSQDTSGGWGYHGRKKSCRKRPRRYTPRCGRWRTGGTRSGSSGGRSKG
jgi:hypothetical protein